MTLSESLIILDVINRKNVIIVNSKNLEESLKDNIQQTFTLSEVSIKK